MNYMLPLGTYWFVLLKLGDGGIRHLSLFNRSLCAKSLWRSLFDHGLWGNIIRCKYQKRLYLAMAPLSPMDFYKNITTVLKQAVVCVLDGYTQWKSAMDLGLDPALSAEWDLFVLNLLRAGIYLTDFEDTLVWTQNCNTGAVTARLAYHSQMEARCDVMATGWTKKVWYGRMPLKLKCFTWLTFFYKILTWSNLQKRGFVGPGICLLCFKAAETTDHLFGTCYFFLSIWILLEKHFCFYSNGDMSVSRQTFSAGWLCIESWRLWFTL